MGPRTREPYLRARHTGTALCLAIVAAIAVAASLSLAPRGARAAACCMAASAYGIGRLAIWEGAAAGTTLSLTRSVGAYSADGEFAGHDGGDYREAELRSSLWAMVRLTRRAQLYAQVPWLVNWRAAAALSDAGAGVADGVLGGRYELVEIGEWAGVPGVALFASISAPLGRSTAESGSVLAADVTTRGAWVLDAGVAIERTRLPWYARLVVAASVPLPEDGREAGRTWLGPAARVLLSGGRELVDGLVATAALRWAWEGDKRYLTGPADGTWRHVTGGFVAVSWRFARGWALQASATSDLPIDSLGRDMVAVVSGTLGLRYGYTPS